MAAVAFVSSHQCVRCQPRSSNLIKLTGYRVLMATLLHVPVENVPSVTRQLSRDPAHRFFYPAPRFIVVSRRIHGRSTALGLAFRRRRSQQLGHARCGRWRTLRHAATVCNFSTLGASSGFGNWANDGFFIRDTFKNKIFFRGFFENYLWQIPSYLRLFGNILYDVYNFYLHKTSSTYQILCLKYCIFEPCFVVILDIV